jgi:NADPH:quinone reductase-like Zn-dependent oxidoreductase
MKAAVLHEAGGIPRYEDFPDPVAGDGEVIIDVKAVAVENVDKAIAAGTHYASEKYIGRFPAIPAFDGIGALPDGTLVGFGNIRLPYGALAEKTVVPQGSYVPIPDGIDPAVATVMASAITAMSLKAAAGFVPGQTVLVQGATGVAGRLAVKVARLLGAGRIVATGRDNDQLREVQAIGADTVINTAVSDEALAQAYLDARGDGYDVVVDYLWGRPS